MTTATAKRARLRDGLRSDRAVLAVGAHDALTAKLIGERGFDAVWVSGLAVATMVYGIPDVNLTTMTETLGAAIRIDRATDAPVIVDCDNGFGALNNVVRTLVEFEAAGIAAICVEDNLFPKRNSLLGAETKRELVPVKEQARRLRAAKEAQSGDDFTLIARVESLIAGHGVEGVEHRRESERMAVCNERSESGADSRQPRRCPFLRGFPHRPSADGNVPPWPSRRSSTARRGLST